MGMLYSSSVFRADILELAPVTEPVIGSARVPGSKSITNRALVLAALADGESVLTGALFSDDTHFMAAALNQLGITVTSDPQACSFVVRGCDGGIPASEADLFVGNSGTTMRFLTAALALGSGTYRVDGVPRMRERPIDPLLGALQQLGVDAVSDRATGCPPVTITTSGVHGREVTLPGNSSSQYFTGLMMMAPYTDAGLTINIDGDLVSTPYVDMTAEMMGAFGVEAEIDEGYAHIDVSPGRYQPMHYAIEPDASNASYFFAAAAITGGRVRIDGIGADSMQGDLDFVDVLEAMGCRVSMGDDWTEIHGPADGVLTGGEFDFSDISDTAQTLAAIAPFADSPVTITGIAHSRLKETDRVAAMATELRKLGQDVIELEDGIVITPKPVNPAEIETYDDHRMAMAFAVTSLRAPGLRILDPNCVNKTFPGYWEELIAISGAERLA